MLRPEPLDLNDVVREMGTILARTVGAAVQIEIALAGEHAGVLADRGQVIQSLLNLAFNARDAMPDGGVLRIETGPADLRAGNGADNGAEAQPGPYVFLRVSDTGVGMDPTTLRRAFEPFFTTKPVGHGTGLGLSTVYGIVRQSGGYVSAESAPGAGAAFTIYLPRVAAPCPAPRWRAGRTVTGRRALPSGGSPSSSRTSQPVREMVARVLADEGYEVVPGVRTARRGAGAGGAAWRSMGRAQAGRHRPRHAGHGRPGAGPPAGRAAGEAGAGAPVVHLGLHRRRAGPSAVCSSAASSSCPSRSRPTRWRRGCGRLVGAPVRQRAGENGLGRKCSPGRAARAAPPRRRCSPR